jgi:hypothetical protein
MYSLAHELALDHQRSLLQEANHSRRGDNLARAQRLRNRADRANRKLRQAAAHLN